MINLGIADLLLFSVVNAMNILIFFIFISRVKWPSTVHKIAIATILMAMPAVVVAFINKTAGCEWLYWAMPIVFVTWAVLALVVDIIRKQEFRQPRNLRILAPFLILFYVGLGGMGVLTWRIGFIFYLITAITFALQFFGTAYA